MTTKTGSGRSMLAYGSWVRELDRSRRESEQEASRDLRELLGQAKTKKANVVGGSLDGATMPEGTRDGQKYQWDESRRRWVYVR